MHIYKQLLPCIYLRLHVIRKIFKKKKKPELNIIIYTYPELLMMTYSSIKCKFTNDFCRVQSRVRFLIF